MCIRDRLGDGHVVHQGLRTQIIQQQKRRVHHLTHQLAVVLHIRAPRHLKQAVRAGVQRHKAPLRDPARDGTQKIGLAKSALARQQQIPRLGFGKVVGIAEAGVARNLYHLALTRCV